MVGGEIAAMDGEAVRRRERDRERESGLEGVGEGISGMEMGWTPTPECEA